MDGELGSKLVGSLGGRQQKHQAGAVAGSSLSKGGKNFQTFTKLRNRRRRGFVCVQPPRVGWGVVGTANDDDC